MALMVFTGMRRGEVLGLRWEDIDFEKKLITVSRAVSYTTNQPIVSEPKTQSGKRTIPLNDQLVEFLKPLQDSGYVVGGEAPPTQMVYRRIERHINAPRLPAQLHFRHGGSGHRLEDDPAHQRTLQRDNDHGHLRPYPPRTCSGGRGQGRRTAQAVAWQTRIDKQGTDRRRPAGSHVP